MTITEVKENLTGMLHGGTLKKVRNIDVMFERAQNSMLSRIDPVDTMRLQALTNAIYDDIYSYPLPADFKDIIDLIPQNNRSSADNATKEMAGNFDLLKNLRQKRVSIEGSEGSKIIKINWRKRSPKVLNELNTLTANGTWATVGTASNLKADNIDYISGSGSLKVDLSVTGDGIQNSSMSVIDLTDEDEVGDFFLWFKIKNSADLANLTSITLIIGNDLTTNYWTGIAQTLQADGSAFKVGWNLIKVPWSTATETGTVNPATIDAAKVTFAITAAITQVRVDSILVAIGRNFDIKYYSKFIFKNTSGTLITKPDNDDATITLDNDAMQIFLLECLIAGAHQMEGVDSTFDLNFAERELYGVGSKIGLYSLYRGKYPTQSKKLTNSYGSLPARGRW